MKSAFLSVRIRQSSLDVAPAREACDFPGVGMPAAETSGVWTGGRAVECSGLENRQTFTGLVGSNPTLSVRMDVAL